MTRKLTDADGAGPHKALLSDKEKLAWLKEHRGLTKATIKATHIGWDGQRYTIPIRDDDGALVNIRRYKPNASSDKMRNTTGYGSPARWYWPFDNDTAADTLLICEGELDAVLAAQELRKAGLGVCVASGTGGASNCPPDLDPMRGRDVVIAYDCDEAGWNGAKKLGNKLIGIAASVKVVRFTYRLGYGEDVTDWFVTHGWTAQKLVAEWESTGKWYGTNPKTAQQSSTEPVAARAVGPRRPTAELLEIAVTQKCDEEGSRNAVGFWLACQLRDEGYTKAEAKPVMLDFQSQVENSKPGEPSYTKEEALPSLASAYREPARDAVGAGLRAGDLSPAEMQDHVDGEARRLTVTALAREKSARDVAVLRAERDGYSTSELTLLHPNTLAAKVEPLKFLIDGVWPVSGFGPFGGQKKSLKTWCAMLHAVAIAAGKPSFNFDRWSVPAAQPVLYICGEGGERLVKRRLQRIASDIYDVDLAALPLYVVVGVAPFDSDAFRRQVTEHVRQIERRHQRRPGLVVLDSLYNYHPADVDVSNLYGRGALLAGLGHWVRSVTADDAQPDGAALWTVDHFNKTGSGLDLDRYGQAGMNAWADSWWNAEVLEAESDAEEGAFNLRVHVGSRQGYHFGYGIHVELGHFEPSLMHQVGNMKVLVTDGDPGAPSRRGASTAEVRDALVKLLGERPHELTKNQIVETLKKGCGVGKGRVAEVWGEVESNHVITSANRKVPEGARRVEREVWSLGGPSRVRAEFEPTQPSNSARTGRVAK